MFGPYAGNDFNGEVFSTCSHKNNAHIYHGQFKCGKPHGFGVLQQEDGSKYEGTFKDGRKHGIGFSRETKEGIEREGIWENGCHKEWL